MKNALHTKLCQESTLLEAWKTVKIKNSAGGIDGTTITQYEQNLEQNLRELAAQLRTGKWVPQPYLGVKIPKKEHEERQLGMLSVGDKVVQCAIKTLVEPRFEEAFVSNSYAYRPAKGHTRAIRRTLHECMQKKNQVVLRLDIDDFFDTMDHQILTERLHVLLDDDEMVRLLMLSVQMGTVNKSFRWSSRNLGTPQGAILSPLLSNYYLTPFDKFVTCLTNAYVRYADDFCIFCANRTEAEQVLDVVTEYLDKQLKLKLNTPEIVEAEKGFEFLGITISKSGLRLSAKKEEELCQKISKFKVTAQGLAAESQRSWAGIKNYYAKVLPPNILVRLDAALDRRLKEIIVEQYRQIPGRAAVEKMMQPVEFLTAEYQLSQKIRLQSYVDLYKEQKARDKEVHTREENAKIVDRRKLEYHKREAEGMELVVSTFGSVVGITDEVLTLKQQGKVKARRPLGSVKHISIIGRGISLSSNLIEYCINHKISIDFYSRGGGIHIGSLMATAPMQCALWRKQAQCSDEKRMSLALNIIGAKLRNQFNLVKYYHKYHKLHYEGLEECFQAMSEFMTQFKKFEKEADLTQPDFITQLVGHEAQGAIKYWAYIRQLLSDNNVGFEKRERQGAKDLVNSMLNYGYAFLYNRVWTALLHAQLNPYESIIHVRQAGKPTFVYDVVEMFRSQVVDRVVISLIQKGQKFSLDSAGLLDAESKKLLTQGVLERLCRYEKYRGEEKTMEEIIKVQAREIAAFFKEDQHYKPYLAKW
jgi:group II intron reverse transcriptase/maturase/CRISPR-associated endonuclease Cas1